MSLEGLPQYKKKKKKLWIAGCKNVEQINQGYKKMYQIEIKVMHKQNHCGDQEVF